MRRPIVGILLRQDGFKRHSPKASESKARPILTWTSISLSVKRAMDSWPSQVPSLGIALKKMPPSKEYHMAAMALHG